MSQTLAGWRERRLTHGACYVWEPEAAQPAGCVVYLHDQEEFPGWQSLEQQLATVQPLLAARGLAGVAPRAPNAWWCDRRYPPFSPGTTAERFVLEEVRSEAIPRSSGELLRTALLGVGMGGQGALRLAYRHPQTFPVAAAVEPHIDFQNWLQAGSSALRTMFRDAEDARQETATLHIHPLNWPRHQWFSCSPKEPDVFEGVDRLRMKLSSLGVPFQCALPTGADAAIDVQLHAAMDFVAERLQQEARRAN